MIIQLSFDIRTCQYVQLSLRIRERHESGVTFCDDKGLACPPPAILLLPCHSFLLLFLIVFASPGVFPTLIMCYWLYFCLYFAGKYIIIKEVYKYILYF